MSFWTKFKRRTRSQEKTAAAAITSLADLVITEEEKTAAASNATSTTVGVTDDIIEDSNGRQFTINEKGVWQKVRSDAQVADPTGQSGKYLTTDGVNTSWGTVDLSTRLSTSGGTLTGNLTISKDGATIYMGGQGGPHGINFIDDNAETRWGFYYRTSPDTITFEHNASSTRFTLDTSGNLTASGNVTAYSDESLKDNIEVIPNALDKVSQIRGVTYNRNDIENNPKHVGVIAQEVEKVLPEVVETNDEGLKTVSYGNMVGLLVEAIKELKAEIDELKGSK